MLRGRIHSIALETERARVRVNSTPPVVAEITLGSVQRLRLATDTEVWVTFKAVEPRIDRSVYKVLTVEASVAARKSFGGTAPANVARAVKEARRRFL